MKKTKKYGKTTEEVDVQDNVVAREIVQEILSIQKLTLRG